MREELFDNISNPVKGTSHRQHHRSRSLDASDNLDLLEAQRLFRQKYLQNRAKFEGLSNDTTDNARPTNEKVVPKTRRFSTEAERSSPTVQEFIAGTKVRNGDDDVLKAPSLVRDVSTKFVTPVHKSMIETSSKERPTANSNVNLRRTMSAREGYLDGRYVSRLNGIEPLQTRWAQQAVPRDDRFKSSTVHKSMPETPSKEVLSKPLSNTLPLTAIGRSSNNDLNLRRTMSARESRANGVEPLQTRWAQRAIPTKVRFTSAAHHLEKHSPSTKVNQTDSAASRAETRDTKSTQSMVPVGDVKNKSGFQYAYPQRHSPPVTVDEVDSGVEGTETFHTKHMYPSKGVEDIVDRSDSKSAFSYTRENSLPTTGKEAGEGVSETVETKPKNKSSLFVYLHRPAVPSTNTELATSQQLDQHGSTVANHARLIPIDGNTQSHFLSRLNTSTRKDDKISDSPRSPKAAEISDTRGATSAVTRTPLAYSSYKMGIVNKTWQPVPVHRHNSFNDRTTQDVSNTRDYRSISRTKSDLDKYRTLPGKSYQNAPAVDQPQSTRSSLPLASPSAKLIVKSRDEILPSIASLKTEFRKFNPPAS